jgi:hypothetical protein
MPETSAIKTDVSGKNQKSGISVDILRRFISVVQTRSFYCVVNEKREPTLYVLRVNVIRNYVV